LKTKGYILNGPGPDHYRLTEDGEAYLIKLAAQKEI
jgi:hypothetical protein